jgi:hypothetical protein
VSPNCISNIVHYSHILIFLSVATNVLFNLEIYLIFNTEIKYYENINTYTDIFFLVKYFSTVQ